MKLIRPGCTPEEYKILQEIRKAMSMGLGFQIVTEGGAPIGQPLFPEAAQKAA